jgi:hypothetical protein
MCRFVAIRSGTGIDIVGVQVISNRGNAALRTASTSEHSGESVMGESAIAFWQLEVERVLIWVGVKFGLKVLTNRINALNIAPSSCGMPLSRLRSAGQPA